jgi:hypothetical protein
MVLNVPQFHGSEINKNVPAPDVVSLQHVSCLQPFQMRFMVRQAGFKLLGQYVPDTCVQELYCEKMSFDEIANYPLDDALGAKQNGVYKNQTAEFLRGYCQI